MTSPWKAYKRWEEKRLVRYDPARWEKARARGEKHFIWRTVLIYGGAMSLGLTGLDVLERKFSFTSLVIRLVIFGLGGRWLAMRTWMDGEARYREYQLRHPPPSAFSADDEADRQASH